MPGSLGPQDRQGGAQDVQYAEDVGIEDRPRLGVGVLFDGPEKPVAGIVGDDVNRAEPVHGALHRVGDRLLVGDVGVLQQQLGRVFFLELREGLGPAGQRRDIFAPAQGQVIVFDNTGVASSTGTTPDTVEEMTADAVAFISALGLTEVDPFGFSLGGFIAQHLALTSPSLVRRLVLAGTGPQGAPGMARWSEEVVSYL
nr:alpha/beta hydrolase [uncultured Arthrobacter sp.]